MLSCCEPVKKRIRSSSGHPRPYTATTTKTKSSKEVLDMWDGFRTMHKNPRVGRIIIYINTYIPVIYICNWSWRIQRGFECTTDERRSIMNNCQGCTPLWYLYKSYALLRLASVSLRQTPTFAEDHSKDTTSSKNERMNELYKCQWYLLHIQ